MGFFIQCSPNSLSVNSKQPQDFYAALRDRLSAREIPKMELNEIEFSEGGLLSEKRIYLRMLRERIVFDVCAAPFGTGFFFTCRTAAIPVQIRLGQLAIVVVSGLVLFLSYWKFFGFVLGTFTFLATLLALIWVLRNTVALGLQDLDKALIRNPVIGPMYEIFFRKETYYRLDTRLCYLQIVPSLVKELAEHFTAEKGIKLVSQYELSPILGDLYKHVEPSTSQVSRGQLPAPVPKVSI